MPTAVLIKEIAYNGNYLPEFVEINDNLFFVAAYNTMEGEQKLFYALFDEALNPINLNQ